MRVLIAGASRGIGLALCAAYAERGDEVIAAVRRPNDELVGLGVELVDGIELRSDGAIAELAAAVGDRPLDVLIYNAAINHDAPTLDEINVDVLRDTIDVNALGAVRTVLALLPSLRAGSKIMLVSIGDRALNFGAMPSRGQFGYRMSKAALTSFGFGLAREVKDRGIAVVVSAPGVVRTDMLREAFSAGRSPLDPDRDGQDPLDVARLFRDRIDELDLSRSPQWHQGPDGSSAFLELRGSIDELAN
jgi:NAD(P)-dependent dehydrogenase (short-subunit alcohol dehydrogenase family)